MPEADTETALGFLRSLYASSDPAGWLTLFCIDRRNGQRSTVWSPLSDLGQMGDQIARHGRHGDVWFGVAPRAVKLDQGRRGGAADCLSIPALWLDVDIAGIAHAAAGLPASRQEAVELVLDFQARQPDAVVSSGYGLQCWWPLMQPLEAKAAQVALQRWGRTWASLAAVRSLHLDNVFNVDRIMRLPGSFNWKGPEPVRVTVRSDFTSGRTDYWEDLDPILAELEPTAERPRTSTAHLAGSRFNELVHPRMVLLSFGWTPAGTGPNQEHYHYPNASNPISATIYLEDQHCSIWSDTAVAQTALEKNHSYDSFGLWGALKHHADWSLAHADLVNNGIPDLGGVLSVERRLILLGGSRVTPVAPEWYWPGWLPRGKLVTLDGDPATGKSTLTLDLAARLTTGADMPDGSIAPAPSDVILLSGEDDMDDTIVWRLLAAGADLNRITYIAATQSAAGQEAPFSIPGDLGLLETLVDQLGASLVIVDVLNEYLDEKVDGHKDQSVRRVLHLLKVMASRTNASVLMLRHLRKEGSDKAIYRGGGSIGIVGAARAGWTVGVHPDDEAQRVLACVKMNLAQRPTSLAFKLLPHESFPCAQIHWLGAVDLGADQLLSSGGKADPDEQSQLEVACDVIKQILDEGREVWVKAFTDELRSLGIPLRTIERARSKLKVQVRKIGKPDINGEMGWKVYLPRSHDQ
jgi:AAA domain